LQSCQGVIELIAGDASFKVRKFARSKGRVASPA